MMSTGATHGGKTRHRVRRQASLQPWHAVSRCGVTLHRPVPSGWGTACQSCQRAPQHTPDHPGGPLQLIGAPPPITPPYRRETTLTRAAGEAPEPTLRIRSTIPDPDDAS